MPETTPASPHAATRFPAAAKLLRSAEQQAAYELIERRRGRVPAPYLPLLGSPRIADLLEQLSTELWTGTLPQRVLEAVFLMTAHRHQCRHQWEAHATKALSAGLSLEMVEAIAAGKIPEDGGSVEAAGRFFLALTERHSVADEVFEQVQRHFGVRGVAELIAFCGLAGTVALLLNVQMPHAPAGPPQEREIDSDLKRRGIGQPEDPSRLAR
ncbi:MULTISPECIES: carboxymuconolactone decarboxylase family protein [Variovorax]|uniref:carboxymuconolactone decarboxylase family protein n=1 Tax=Variovorax TaxID=34072 RepID=UPI0028582FB6|nr:carboxymuconolactone decarboxylase family protein [Variovorax sp. 3319]MDR6890780.1 alkylhydroperoxidase family enzyme [Variovorax sp. 3319]